MVGVGKVCLLLDESLLTLKVFARMGTLCFLSLFFSCNGCASTAGKAAHKSLLRSFRTSHTANEHSRHKFLEEAPWSLRYLTSLHFTCLRMNLVDCFDTMNCVVQRLRYVPQPSVMGSDILRRNL